MSINSNRYSKKYHTNVAVDTKVTTSIGRIHLSRSLGSNRKYQLRDLDLVQLKNITKAIKNNPGLTRKFI